MSGDIPPPPDPGPAPDEQPPGDQPGYWEQKAAEEAAAGAPPTEQVQLNPQSAVPAQDQPQPGYPYPGTPPYGYPQPGQPYQQPQQPYGQPYGAPYQQQYQQPFQQPYGQPYQPPAGYAVADLPQANTALVLGLIALIGGFMCGLPALVGPFAWVTGHKARRTIRQAPGYYGGEGKATAGMVLGIIATVLLALAILAVAILVVVAASDPSAFDTTTSNV